jgi:putative flippase GtrA
MRQVGFYLASGATAAAANFLSRFAFSHWMPFEAAVVLSYIVGMVVGFTLMRRFAFKPGATPVSRQVLGYCVVNAAGVLQAVIVSSLALRWLFPKIFDEPSAMEPLAHLIGIAVPTVSSYFGHRYITFR